MSRYRFVRGKTVETVYKDINYISESDIVENRTRSFEDLEALALEGVMYHWGRNQNHAVANDVKIGSDSYQFFTNAVNTEENAMDDLELIYNTNGDWMHSGNPGSATGNPYLG